jgi:carboxypeptidase T
MRLRLLTLCGLVAAGPALAADPEPPSGTGPWIVRASFHERSQVDRLAAELEPWEVDHDQRYVVVDVDREGWQRLIELGFTPVVDAARTEYYTRPRTPLPGQTEAIPGFPCYRTVEETFAAAQSLVLAHPDLATWIDAGDSWEKLTPGGLPGYDMMVLRVTSSATPGPKPALFVNSAIHAREYTPAEVTTRFAEHLVNGYGVHPDVTWILDHNEIHFMLQANPDGRKHAEGGQLWRKNTNQSYCGATSTSRGADLNRNFPFQWGCCGGSSASPCSDTFRGASAASEPETQATRAYATALWPAGWVGGNPPPSDAAGMFLDIHSAGQRLMWPWGSTTTVAPNGIALQTLGRKLAFFNNHNPHQAIYLYTTDGSTRDFAYGDRGVASFTFELGTDFFQDCGSFESTIYPTNLQALLFAARVVRRPFEWPAGPEMLSALAQPAAVNVGQPVTISATANDTRFNQTNGTEPTQNVAAAEAYLDSPPWSPGATPVPMVASDGAFDEPVETVQATLSTAGWSVGRHLLFVRARDAANNWGPVAAVFVDVSVPVELQGFTIE